MWLARMRERYLLLYACAWGRAGDCDKNWGIVSGQQTERRLVVSNQFNKRELKLIERALQYMLSNLDDYNEVMEPDVESEDVLSKLIDKVDGFRKVV